MKSTIISLTRLCAAMFVVATTVAGAGATPANFPRKSAATYAATQLGRKVTGNPSVDAWRFGGAGLQESMRKAVAPAFSFDNVGEWGFLTTPDGKEWVYTQQFEYTDDWQSFVSSSLVTVYDDRGNLVGEVNVKVPDGYICNQIQLVNKLSRRFFDFSEASAEIMVSMHLFDSEYNMMYRSYVYEIGASEPKWDCDGIVGSYYSHKINDWTRVERLVTIRDGVVADAQGELREMTYVDIYCNPGWGDDGPVLVKTLSVPNNLLYYSDFAPFINIYTFDGKPYFALSHYEKSYMTPESEQDYTRDPVPTDDNHFIVDLYDTDLELVETFSVPVEQTDGYLYTFYGLGIFSYDDISNDTFAPGRNYIVTRQAYETSSDSYVYTMDAYTADGTRVANIETGATDWKTLYTPAGATKQYAFVKPGADDVPYFEMVDYPSCTVAATFPAIIDDRILSINFDRVPVGDDYRYVFSMATGDLDSEDNVIASIGWYHPDATLDHFDTVNLGPTCQYFTAMIYGEYLNPYLFNTDNHREYIGIAKLQRPSSTKIDNVLMIINDEGRILESFKGDDERGDYANGGIINGNQLFLYYLKEDNWKMTLDFYDLPFTRFEAGGTGTAQDPYLIATPGDLQQMAAYPTAHYKLVSDLDMSLMSSGFTPVQSFSGSFDGAGHVISNLLISSSSSEVGLFGTVEGYDSHVVIKDVTFVDPVIMVDGNNSVAVVVAQGMGAELSDVTVKGARIEGCGNYANVGTLIGSGYLGCTVNECNVADAVIDVTSCSATGGIAGELRTGSAVASTAFSGSITAQSQVGGVVGATITGDEKVTDCHVDATITGANTIGGVVGYGRPTINRCYVEGELTATHGSWDGLATGGVIGYLVRNWQNVGETKIIECNVVALSAINGSDASVHRIAGNTILNESDDEEASPNAVGLDADLGRNYAVASLAVVDEAIGGDSDTSVEGLTIAADEITDELLGSLGYHFGISAEEPWKRVADGICLYFEQAAGISVSFGLESLQLTPDATADVVITVTGVDASSVEVTLPSLLELVEQTVTDGTIKLTVRAVQAGYDNIIASAGAVKASCGVTVSEAGGIDTVAPDRKLAIGYDGETVTADGAAIAVYNISGNLAAQGRDIVSVAHLSHGIYIVKAIAPDGRTAARKISHR